MNNNENAEYNNTLHFHVYNILCLHIIDNLTNDGLICLSACLASNLTLTSVVFESYY